MLEIKNLSKKFNNLTAVDDVSFSVKPGEIFSLIGPNGSGKTTIIKIICGLLQPTKGEVAVDGHNVVKDPIGAKKLIGYIPDEPAIWSSMTGEEFLHFTGALYDIKEKERIERISNLLSIFNLKGIEKGYFENFSRGNKQKFVIIAALLHNPKLLLIDEPIVGLDPKSAEIAKQKFVEFSKNGGAVFLVTHTLSVAQSIADRIGILHKGKLLEVDNFRNLQAKAKLPDTSSLEEIYKVLVE